MKTLIFLKIITILNVLVATGFSIVSIINPALIIPSDTSPEKALCIFALYAAARTVPLTIIALISLFSKQCNALIAIAVLTGIIQLLDGFIGIYQHDISKMTGPFIISTAEFSAIFTYLKSDDYKIWKNG